jgi:charged multivesicular body protein 2A
MNQSMNLPAIQRVMMEFEKQSGLMDMKEELMEDTMEDIFEADEDEG